MLHFGALEAGGTKMVCAVGNAQGQILERISLPTRDPGLFPGEAGVCRGRGVLWASGFGSKLPNLWEHHLVAQAAMAKFPHAAPLPGGSGGARGL